MQDKPANTGRARKTSTTLAFRYPIARRRVLESIADERQQDLSELLRKAADNLIAEYMKAGQAA